MRWIKLMLLAGALTGASLGGAEEAPYKRLLQGDDARKAAALEKQIDKLWAAGKLTEAADSAEELLALRRRVQGESHWEAVNVAQHLQTLRQAAALPAEKQRALAEAGDLTAKGVGLYTRGKHAEAETLFRKALALRQEVLGGKHPDTARSCSNLAGNLQAQGRLKEAEALHLKALTIREEVLGRKHPDTATSCNNLASNVRRQGRVQEAETLYRRALDVCEEVLGPRHLLTATCCDNLAATFQGQRRFQEAETLFRKALAVHEAVQGVKHRETAAACQALATTLEALGRSREAETLLRKVLAVREELLGPRDPDTATACSNLAHNLDAQGRYKEAEPLIRKALALSEELLGPRHPNTAGSYNNLGLNLDAQGRYQDAEPLIRRALALSEELLGSRDPHTATGWNNLAYNLEHQGRHREAEPLCRKALALREEILGNRHPLTAQSYNNLAGNLEAQGRYKEAEELYRKALALCEEVLGRNHLDTIKRYNNLGANLRQQGQPVEGEEFHRKALAACSEVLGNKHLLTAALWYNLASDLVDQRRHKEAEELYRKSLGIREELLGRQHPVTATACYTLACNLQVQGRTREAEALWREAARSKEAARQRLAASALDRAAALAMDPHLGLAVCRAGLERPLDAWNAAEAGLGRGVLDDLAAGAAFLPDPDRERRGRDRAARLDALDKVLIPLLVAEKLDEADRRRRDELLEERAALDEEAALAAADRSNQAVLPLERIQARLDPDTALLFWIDFPGLGDYWGCVVRHSGPPAWVRLKGSGPQGAWTAADYRLPLMLRDDLARGETDFAGRARRLAAQRLEPLAPHLAATADLPAARRLVVVPFGIMAGVPAEVLSDRYLVSYAPSGSVFARLRDKHRPLDSPTLLALGDPNFNLPDAGPPPEPPAQGLYLSLVLPGGNAAKAGLRSGDVLLRYGDANLSSQPDLQLKEEGDPIPISVWRDGKTLDSLRIAPGKLGVVVSDDPPAVALRKRREVDLLADSRSRGGLQALPGTRLEVGALASLLPEGKSTLLLGSKASEQELDALTAAGKLKGYRLLHLATHGTIDPTSAAHSWLALARDRLPDPEQQARLAAAGKKVPTGRLFVGDVAEWDLDADLVTLSACRTGLGRDGGGEGLLGFSQVLLGRGARSVLLSLWKVDDTATALLMMRFYQNLLGKREGLEKAMPKAEALREAKSWLRALPRAEAELRAGKLAKGTVRLGEEDKTPVPAAALPASAPGESPFAHPRYWAAFILIGDPE